VAVEQHRLRVEQAPEHGLAHALDAQVGRPGEAVLADEAGHAAQREQADHHHRHRPQRERVVLEAAVEQRVEQRGIAGSVAAATIVATTAST
jgi:hypothetical protein